MPQRTVRHGFGRDRRLLIPEEFKTVLAFRCSVRSGAFLVHALPRQDADGPRLGMIVAKRVFKRAVDRNRARRLIREVFRLRQHDLPSQDYVVRVTGRFPEDTNSAGAELAALFARLEQCLRKGRQPLKSIAGPPQDRLGPSGAGSAARPSRGNALKSIAGPPQDRLGPSGAGER